MDVASHMYFSKEDVRQGLHLKLIKFLFENMETPEYRIDVHAYSEAEEAGTITVEWVRQPWDAIDDYGCFKFVDGDEHICKEIVLPNQAVAYAPTEEAAKKLLREWDKQHKDQ